VPVPPGLYKVYDVELPGAFIDPDIRKVPIEELTIPRIFVALPPVDILPVIVNEDVADIETQMALAVVAHDKFPIIVAEFDWEINIIEPVELIIVGDVIVTPLLIIYVPCAIALLVAEFRKLVTVIFVSIVTIWLLANTSSDAVGIMLPLHVAELLQFPDVIGHLFGIIKL